LEEESHVFVDLHCTGMRRVHASPPRRPERREGGLEALTQRGCKPLLFPPPYSSYFSLFSHYSYLSYISVLSYLSLRAAFSHLQEFPGRIDPLLNDCS
jgi:hypothetical protein